jgi:hypothetical protein
MVRFDNFTNQDTRNRPGVKTNRRARLAPASGGGTKRHRHSLSGRPADGHQPSRPGTALWICASKERVQFGAYYRIINITIVL